MPGSKESQKKYVPPTRYRTRNLLESPYLQPIVPTAPPVHLSSTLRNSSKTLARATYSRPTSVNASRQYDNKQREKPSGSGTIQNGERKLSVASSQCKITLRFASSRSSPQSATRHNVCIYQQINRGNPVFVYQGWLHFMDTFTFTSKPHRGFPFSITIYVNSLLVQRVSVCCEYKPRKGCKLGGSKGLFTFANVSGSFPCYKCLMSESSKTKSDYQEERAITPEHSVTSSEVEDRSSDSQNYEDDFEDDSDKGSKREAPPRDATNGSASSIPDHELDPRHDHGGEDESDNPTTVDDEESQHIAEITLESVTENRTDERLEPASHQPHSASIQPDAFPTRDTTEESTPEREEDDNSADSEENAIGGADNTDSDSRQGDLTSDDETDDDVVYQAGDPAYSSARNADHPVAASGSEEPDRWPANGHRKPFDSSDEEDVATNDGRGSAQLTVTADVHTYGTTHRTEPDTPSLERPK